MGKLQRLWRAVSRRPPLGERWNWAPWFRGSGQRWEGGAQQLEVSGAGWRGLPEGTGWGPDLAGARQGLGPQEPQGAKSAAQQQAEVGAAGGPRA